MTVFTFSREFLETFDRRLDDLLRTNGIDFILGARAWLSWLREDVRSRMAFESLLHETDEARATLDRVVQELLPRWVELRKQLEALCGNLVADRPPTDDPQAHADEAFTFRSFDARAAALSHASRSPPKWIAEDPVTDPFQPLRSVLKFKANAFRRVPPNKAGEPASDDEVQARLEMLAPWKYQDVDLESRRAMEHVGMMFFASPGRALRLVSETLERGLTLAWTPGDSWFSVGIGRLPGAATRISELARAILEHPSSRGENSEAARSIDEYVQALLPLVRRAGAGLRAKIGERALLVSAIDRFRLRCERYDVDRMRQVAAVREKENGRRSAELRLTQELAKYLFDAGFETFCEVPSGEGRADLVQVGQVYVEAKQTSLSTSEKSRIVDGYREAMDGVRQFSVRSAVLAVYVLEGPRYEPVQLIPARAGAPETHVVVIDLRTADQRGAKKPQPVIPISEVDFVGVPSATGATDPLVATSPSATPTKQAESVTPS